MLGIYDVAVQGKVGWAIGDSGLLLRTTDGGNTWKRIELPIRLAGNWFRGIAPDAERRAASSSAARG